MKIYHVIQSDKAHLSDSRVTDISEGFTHKMAVKISQHRYGTKLRHCQFDAFSALTQEEHPAFKN